MSAVIHRARHAVHVVRQTFPFRLPALLVAVFFFTGANSLLTTVIGLRAAEEGMSPIAIGLLGAAYFAGFVSASLFGAEPVKRVGHIRAFAAFGAIMIQAVLIYPVAVNEAVWLVLRFASGWGAAILYMIIESWLNAESTNENRGQVLSRYRMVDLASVIVGQLLLSVVPVSGALIFTVVGLSFLWAIMPVALTRQSGPAPITSAKADLKGLFSASPMAAAGGIAIGITGGIFWSVAPFLLREQGFDSQTIGLFISATILGGAISQWPFGRLSDRIDRRWVIVLTALITGAAAIGLALAETLGLSFPVLIALGMVYGGGYLPIYSLCVAHANDQVKGGNFVPTAAALLTCYGFGAVAGPLIAGAAGLLAREAPFLVGAASMFGLALFGLYRMTAKASPRKEDKERFVEPPRTTTQALELDPRAHERHRDANRDAEPPPGH